jgi:hypothetical protein
MFAPPVAKQKAKSAPPQTAAVTQRNALARPLKTKDHAPREPRAAPELPGAAWDFSAVPPSPGDPAAPPRAPVAPRLPIQAKHRIGGLDDPLEHEAERVAREVMAEPLGSARPPRLRAGAAGEPLDTPRTGVPPDSFNGRGEPLASSLRGFFEQRFEHDFSRVRVHQGAEAAASANAFGARAYTYGRDIVFGAGEFAPQSATSRKLLAHELAHVLQQGEGHPLVQRSPLSDKVKAAWDADPRIEVLLARLGQDDVQQDQKDGDVDAEIARILAARPDDLWVAQKIRQGKLGETTGARGVKVKGKPVKRPVEVVFFRGSTERRALVIAGVHGSEKQGIEVARMLMEELKKTPPLLTTIVVPSLFPDNATLTGDRAREGGTPTNRNFPNPSDDLAAATPKPGAKPRDAEGRAMLPENVMLVELMERFNPERIISIHGTQAPGQAGVFYDPRAPSAEEARVAGELSKGIDGGQELPPAVQQQLYRARLRAVSAQAAETDRDLSLRAAGQIDTATAGVKGRENRGMRREKERMKEDDKKARLAHPSVGGNVGPGDKLENASWPGGVAGGVSLGGYAPARGMSVFTVEPPVDAPSSSYPSAKGDPDAKDEVSGKVDKLSRADRITELKAYAEAVRTVLLGT